MQAKKKLDGCLKADFTSLALPLLFVFVLLLISLVSADPEGPSTIGIVSNETGGITGAATLNISGGYIATINITAASQNLRWKAFVGNVTGTFSLEDAGGSSIYDWSLTSVSGEIYATRNSTAITWTTIQCANVTLMEAENLRMNHTSANDNITATFDDTTHDAFVVASSSITADTCPTLNTYVSDASQDTSFEEMIVVDGTALGSNLIYVTIMEEDVIGFDGATYDFQMIVPEIGLEGYTGSTAYYLYVELT